MIKSYLGIGSCIFFMIYASTSLSVELPEEPIRLTIVQRHYKSVPGYDGDLQIGIRDITGGQVLLTIRDGNYWTIVDTRSVIGGDVIEFDYKDQKLYLTVIELRNVLIGHDFGVFELSSAPPVKQENAENYKIVYFDYNDATNRGVISVKTRGEGIECRKWLVKNIGAICSSKNITLKAGAESEEGGYYRVLDETIKDDILTVHFEAAW